MADQMLFIGWGEVVRGREGHAIEVFNETLGLLGTMQQDGRIERFDTVLLEPSGELNGYIEIFGTPAQISALHADEEFQRNTADASMVVDRLRHHLGWTNAGVARQMGIFQDAITKLPQLV